MNPRRLDGGSQELASLILRNLQGAFPGVEFSIVPLDQTEFVVYWRYKAPGAPSEKDVRLHMALHWPSIDARLRDFDMQAIAGISASSAGAAQRASSLASSVRRKGNKKACPACNQELRMSARVCIYCGYGFPLCEYCNTLIVPGARFCSKCGLDLFSVPTPTLTPDSLPPAAKFLYDAISQIDNEQHAREFFNSLAWHLPRELSVETWKAGQSATDIICLLLGECFKAGMTPERVAMWRRVIVAASVDAALHAQS
jgi:ribosomal protein L40E